MHRFATPTPVSAVLDIPAGRIRFVAADGAEAGLNIHATTAHGDVVARSL